ARTYRGVGCRTPHAGNRAGFVSPSPLSGSRGHTCIAVWGRDSGWPADRGSAENLVLRVGEHAGADRGDLGEGAAGQVDAAALDERAAVVDPDDHRLAVGRVGHPDPGVELQRLVRGGQPVRVEVLA